LKFLLIVIAFISFLFLPPQDRTLSEY